MRAWAFMLGGLIVWTIHFFSLYIVASIFLTSTITRVLTIAITLACLVADAALLLWAGQVIHRHEADPFKRWRGYLAVLAAAISFIAVLWQGLPALFL